MPYIIKIDRPKPYRVCWRDPTGRRASRTFADLKDARKYRAQLELQAEAAPVRSAELEAASKDWLADRAAVTTLRTQATYASGMRHLMDYLGPARVDLVTRAQVEAWRNETAKTLRPASVRNYVKTARAFFRWAQRRGYCQRAPTDGVDIPRFKRRIPDWLDPDKTAKLLTELSEVSQEWHLAALFAARGGLRLSEVRLLRWDDLDMGTGTIRVNETKSANPRMVPMHPEIATVLKVWPHIGIYVFPAVKDRAGIEHRSPKLGWAIGCWMRSHGYGITFHGLRHTFASQLAAAGAPENELRDLLGHVSTEITRLYCHSRNQQQRAHVLALGIDTPTPPVQSSSTSED